jgi:hypothetical protein
VIGTTSEEVIVYDRIFNACGLCLGMKKACLNFEAEQLPISPHVARGLVGRPVNQGLGWAV